MASDGVKYPQKRHYRQRAHSNPTADHKVELYVYVISYFLYL